MKTPDVIVVGSGFGGAVTACRLAQAGLDVVVLERGRWWGPGEGHRPFPRGLARVAAAIRNVQLRRGPRPLRRDYVLDAEGLFELHMYRQLDVLTASGVGGGSLIYTNMQVEPGEDFFSAFPAELRGGELHPYYDMVREMLRPEPLTTLKTLPTKNEVFARGAETAGRGEDLFWPDLAVALGDPDHPHTVTNAAGVTQRTCNWCGDCVLGCMDKSKTTLDLTYVPAALAAGAEVRTMAEVKGLAPAGRLWQVRYLDRATGRHRVLSAPRVVLAAGTLGTLRILLASRDRYRTLRGTSSLLGRNFGGNADQGGALVATDEAFEGARGPAVNALIRRNDASGDHAVAVGEAGLPTGGLRLPGLVASRLATSHLTLAMGVASHDAAVTLDGDGLDIDQANSLDPGAFAAIDRDVAALAEAVGASHVVRRIRLQGGADANFTVHPLGGCGIGNTPDDGVCDHSGAMFGAPGIFVADGALYPRAIGLPPSMTIAALAERIARLILEE